MNVSSSRQKRNSVAFGAGALLGAAAGVVGVGGGEFRIPVLYYLLDRRTRTAAAVNLVVGTFTVSVGVARRWGEQVWSAQSTWLAIALVIASMVGAAVGVNQASKLPVALLRHIVEIYLAIVGLWMVYEGITVAEHFLLKPTGISQVFLGSFVAFLVAVFSAAVGVAGGELRIPALLYLCAVPIKEAGMLSLVASVPTVVTGGLVYGKAGDLPRSTVPIALYMSLGSLLGVIFGVYLLPRMTTHAIKAILGAILVLASAALAFSEKPKQLPAA